MDQLRVGWLSFSEVAIQQLINQLSVYGLENLCLISADMSSIECMVLHSDDSGSAHHKILLNIRKTVPQIPAIIMIHAPSHVRAELLKKGMDDVVSPNIHIIELYERIIRLRNRYDKGQYVKKIGPYHINYLEREIWFNNIFIPLKPREYLLFEFLLKNAPKAISRAQLLYHLWNCKHEPGTNSVEVHIWRLRKKLSEYAPAAPKINMVRGIGYKIDLEKHSNMAL